MREECKRSGASEARGSGAGAVTEGGGGWLGKAWSEKENVFPVKTRPTRGLDGPAGCFRPAGSGAARGLAGPEAKRAAGSAGPKIRKKKFLN
jgi:hypothetical protein